MSLINKPCILVLGLISSLVLGCGSKSKSKGTDTDTSSDGGTVADAGGGASGAAETTTLTTALTAGAATNINTVQGKMIPASLVAQLGPSLALDNGGPCGNQDFFACQPTLLKIYLTIAKMIVGQTQSIVDKVGPKLSQLTLPSTGSAVPATVPAAVDDMTAIAVARARTRVCARARRSGPAIGELAG